MEAHSWLSREEKYGHLGRVGYTRVRIRTISCELSECGWGAWGGGIGSQGKETRRSVLQERGSERDKLRTPNGSLAAGVVFQGGGRVSLIQ